MITRFKHLHSIHLQYFDDCNILGFTPDGTLYAEEFYDESYLAQYQISNAKLIIVNDEDAGRKHIVPFEMPAGTILPDRPSKHPLNYAGLRYRGLREEERVMEWLLPLSIMEKMPLLTALDWDIPAMLLLGIAESQVLAQAQIGKEWLICRRLHLAYALPERRFDATRLAYDYDTRLLYLLQPYNPVDGTTPALHESLAFAGLSLQRPMDILYANQQLILAEGGTGEKPSRIIIWQAEN